MWRVFASDRAHGGLGVSVVSIPDRIGKYALTRKIGEGAMGVVYEAFDPDIRRALAIKTIRRDLIDGDQGAAAAAARFRNEAQAAGRLLHPGIAAVYEYGETEHCAYIAMEYVAGNSLREFMSRGVRFAEKDIVSVMVQLLDALQFAHEQGVWHRDIKPANLIVTRNGRVKVADFGIARIENAGLTVDGALIGTPGYMAPEQFGDLEIDHRVDLYASGAVLYQLLTGRQVHSGSMESVMYKTVAEQAVPPSQIEGAAHWASYDAVVLRALARDRDQRFASAREFQDALLALSAEPASASLSEDTLVMLPTSAVDAADRAARTHREGLGRESSAGLASAPATGTAGLPLPGTGGTGALPSGWGARTLAELESTLARHVGPMARILVRRAASQTTEPRRLRELLAEHISDGAQRETFLSATRRQAATTGGATRLDTAGAGKTPDFGTRAATAAGAVSAPLTDELIDRVTALLSARIGPIARILVRKAAGQSRDRGAFREAVLAQIDDAQDSRAIAAELDRLCRDG